MNILIVLEMNKKTKTLISCTVSALLICISNLAFAKSSFCCFFLHDERKVGS